eukprot:1915581-Pyramimonas_sp.AAC.1
MGFGNRYLVFMVGLAGLALAAPTRPWCRIRLTLAPIGCGVSWDCLGALLGRLGALFGCHGP